MQALQVKKLDHVNIHTANVDRLVEWYDRVLGMKAGDRPPFPFSRRLALLRRRADDPSRRRGEAATGVGCDA
jgi:catechol 2,3-dioxygenase-like lactoylglutathione lyase family enzyme